MPANKEILEIYEYALDKYGEFAKALEKTDAILKKCTVEEIPAPRLTGEKLREALIFAGKLFEEDTRANVYIALVDLGRNQVLTVCKLNKGKLLIASYAREGLIKQHLAEKAIKEIKDRVVV